MHPGGSAGHAAPTAIGSVTGHSYTAAYRYQLVIGKVGGWAIPYPLTIPQAVTGISAVVVAMVTASWWYPFTGMGGLLGVVALPIIGIRVISRIRPEGRSVSDWLYGWGVAQSHGLTGRGVRLHIGSVPAKAELGTTPVASSRIQADSSVHPGTSAVADPIGAAPITTVPKKRDGRIRPSALPRGSYTRQHQAATASSPRKAVAPHASIAEGFTGLVAAVLPGRATQPHHLRAPHMRQPRTRTVQRSKHSPATQPLRGVPPTPQARRSSQRPTATQHSRWSAFTRLFSNAAPPPEPQRVPVFDPWGVAHTQGGM